jgi:adenylate kinase family enzyme
LTLNISQQRILIIGCGGAGKSTLARKLAASGSQELIHLDKHYWNSGWVAATKENWREIVSELVKQPSWIMDGNFAGTFDLRLPLADLVIFLDYPRLLCMWRVFLRFLKYHGQTRPDMAPGCRETGFDREFFLWIWNFKKHTNPQIESALSDYSRIKQLRFRRPRDLKNWLDSLD